MKIIFLGYRDWATQAFEELIAHPKITNYEIISKIDDLNQIQLDKWDLLVTLGWSEELGERITKEIFAIGLHCAELDRYSYGSPLQLQIIDGITHTKHRIFPFIWDKNSARAHTHSREYSHEVDLSLEGSISDIFNELTRTSILLLNQFFDDYPNISWQKWPKEAVIRKKRVPEDSKLSKESFLNFELEDLYNFIRCLGDPYPNAYLEDKHGNKLFFKNVRLEKK
tara:strand:+ start:18 stop:692 length:675 start_codon:yes stop_codon:yes gene_type:complete